MSVGRIVVRETAPNRPAHETARTMELGETVTVGRAGDLRVGTAVVDQGISATALAIAVDESGWIVVNTNRNGALLHPWGRPEGRADPHLAVRLPLVAIRLLGVEQTNRHRVLLEHHLAAWPAPTGPGPIPVDTREAGVPKRLTSVELLTLRTVFASVLGWPPERDEPMQLREAARALGIGHRAVRGRLETVKQKAEALGMTGVSSVTDPRLVYFLVSAGYVPPPVPPQAPDPGDSVG